jgi:ABC-2 type transport system ATP-binding protein
MDDLSEQYLEVLVSPEHVEQALALGPIDTRDMLGKKSMIFERGDRTQLESFGEIHVPSVADLFVAKMQRS